MHQHLCNKSRHDHLHLRIRSHRFLTANWESWSKIHLHQGAKEVAFVVLLCWFFNCCFYLFLRFFEGLAWCFLEVPSIFVASFLWVSPWVFFSFLGLDLSLIFINVAVAILCAHGFPVFPSFCILAVGLTSFMNCSCSLFDPCSMDFSWCSILFWRIDLPCFSADFSEHGFSLVIVVLRLGFSCMRFLPTYLSVLWTLSNLS